MSKKDQKSIAEQIKNVAKVETVTAPVATLAQGEVKTWIGKVIPQVKDLAKVPAVIASPEGLVSVRCIASKDVAEKIANMIKTRGHVADVVVIGKGRCVIGRLPANYLDKTLTTASRAFRREISGMLTHTK